MLTRWQRLYPQSVETVSIGPSATAAYAADRFATAGAARVLDVGCGAGRDAAYLLSCGIAVVGVDAARAGLALARQRPALRTACLVEADARALPFPGASFPAIYCFGLLHEFVGGKADQDVASVLFEIERVLAPGGLLVLTVLAGDPEFGLPHLRLFTKAMLDVVMCRFVCIAQDSLDDLGCTGRPDYTVLRGTYLKLHPALPAPASVDKPHKTEAQS